VTSTVFKISPFVFSCVPLKLSVLMGKRCDGQSEGFVRFSLSLSCLLGSQSTSAELRRENEDETETSPH